MPAPFVPTVRSAQDTKNFSSEFTMMDVTYSPAIVPANGEKLFKVRCKDLHGFIRCIESIVSSEFSVEFAEDMIVL